MFHPQLIITKRPASPSLPTSPSKRIKTPSPQKDLLRGYYTPSPSSFQTKLERMGLMFQPNTKPPASTSDDHTPSVANASTHIQNPKSKIGIRQSLKEDGKSLAWLNLRIGPSNTVEGSVIQDTINSIDMGFKLVDENNIQRSHSVGEVKVICEVFPGVSDVLHFPPYLRILCDKLPERIPRTLAGIPCYFTTKFDEIRLKGTFCRGPAISVGTICPPWILPSFDTRKRIAQHLVNHGVRSVAWLRTRWLLEMEVDDSHTARKLPCKINGLIVSYRCLLYPKEHLQRHILPSRTDIFL